jgi:uncharacterized repeat protein (TIGR03803 family)
MRPSRFLLFMFSCSFLLSTFSPAQTVTTTLVFDGTNGDEPQLFNFIQGRDGNIIGTTMSGGPFAGHGFVYREQPATFALNPLYHFTNSDGYGSFGGVTLASDGNYYGTLAYAGTYNYGTLYKVSPSGTSTSLHAFTGGADGAQPYGAPIQGSDGNLYGTTTGAGGTTNATVYRYTPQGVFTVIYTVPLPGRVEAPVLEAPDGSLYVLNISGGDNNLGEVLKLTKEGVVTSRYSFACAGDGGCEPSGQLFEGNDGSLYGTTALGGAYDEGTIYKLDPTLQVETVLHVFGSTPNDGYIAYAGVAQGSDGKFYGTTTHGGLNTCGTIYQLTPAGGYTQLYDFPIALFGCPYPVGAPLQSTNGTFFGGTWYGSSYGGSYGTLYTLDMGLGPFITFVRAQGKAGTTVQILGQKLTGATSVTFNGVPATSFRVVKDSYLTAVVPSGASTGRVVVTTPARALTSNRNFRVSQ